MRKDKIKIMAIIISVKLFLFFFAVSCNHSSTKKNDNNEEQIIKTDTSTSLKFKNVTQVIHDKHSTTWVKLDNDSASAWLHFNLYNPDTLWVAYTNECWVSFPIKIIDEKIHVYWDQNIDTKHNFEIVKAMDTVNDSLLGRPFIVLSLENDSTLKTNYLFPELIKKLNSSEKDRVLFPDYFIATHEYR